MTVINPSSISGITSITMPSGSNVLTIHTTDGAEKFRIDSSGNVKVGSAATISPDGDVFATGVTTTGSLVSSGAISGTTGTFSSDVSVSGTLTYEDVTNIDSVGVVTARSGLVVGTGVTLSKDGDVFFTGVSTATSFSDSKGDLRSIPANSQSGAYVAVAADAGKAIYISTGGVTINDSVFSAGDAVTIINNSGSNQTITQGSGVTLYNAADATTGNRTLAGRGMATIWFISASGAYISGAGLS